VSLTTIPTKFDTIHATIDSLLNQTLMPKKIVLNIPKIYNFRLNDNTIDSSKLCQFIEKYGDRIVINQINNDYGPGTKLLGLFSTDLISEDENTFIVLVDDDVKYKPYMIEYFDKCVQNNNMIEVASYCVFPCNNITIGQGVDGYFIKQNLLNKFQEYYTMIKAHDYVNYHDDLYISYYFGILKKEIHYIIPPYNSGIYELTPSIEIDALKNIEGKYSRGLLNIKVAEILNNLRDDNKFEFLTK